MLTEVDSRQTPSGEVSLWMDTDAQVYLVAVEGYAPFTCLSRDRALAAYRHPFVYMPLEGHRIVSNGLRGGSPNQEPYVPDRLVQDVARFGGIDERTSSVFVDLKNVLSELDDSDFRWTVALLSDIVQEISRERGCNRPYNRDDEEIEF